MPGLSGRAQRQHADREFLRGILDDAGERSGRPRQAPLPGLLSLRSHHGTGFSVGLMGRRRPREQVHDIGVEGHAFLLGQPGELPVKEPGHAEPELSAVLHDLARLRQTAALIFQ
jgi:hypothetical protein